MAVGHPPRRHPHSLRVDLGYVALRAPSHYSFVGNFHSCRNSAPAKFHPLWSVLGFLPAGKSGPGRRFSISVALDLLALAPLATEHWRASLAGCGSGNVAMRSVDHSQRRAISSLHTHSL